jgi:SH3-like domain-containing protein
MIMSRSSLLTIIVIVLTIGLVFPVAWGAERMAVKSDTANIRSGPGMEYEQLWQIEKYHPLMIIQKKGDWYQFQDFEGDKGWIHRSLLDTTETVIVSVNSCNVRSGPGTQFDIVFTVGKGIPFKVIQKKGQWFEVQHADGDRGWIFKALLW